MSRSLLLILLTSWSSVVPLSALRCGTGVAHPGETLSVPHSLLHADVALLKAYRAADVDACTADCCAQKFGSCTVATYTRTSRAGNNCRHFNCRPITNCRFTSSNTTDSVSYSSSPAPSSVPSRNALDSSPSSPTTPNNQTHDQQVSSRPEVGTDSQKQHFASGSDHSISGESLSASESQKQQVANRSDQQISSLISVVTNDSQNKQATNRSDQQISSRTSAVTNDSQKQQATNRSDQQMSSTISALTNDSQKQQVTNVTRQRMTSSAPPPTNQSQEQGIVNAWNQQTSSNTLTSTNLSQSYQSTNWSNQLNSTISIPEPTNLTQPVTQGSDHYVSYNDLSEWPPASDSQFGGSAPTVSAPPSSGVKPRKGVIETDQFSEDLIRKGVKPRKGVSLDGGGLNDTESNIKPRKGVGTNAPTDKLSSELLQQSMQASESDHSTETSAGEASHDALGYDLASALADVFEDDSVKPTLTTGTFASKSFTQRITPSMPYAVESSSLSLTTPSSPVTKHSTTDIPLGLQSSRSSAISWTEVDLSTPHQWAPGLPTKVSTTRPPQHQAIQPSTISRPSIYEHSRLLFNQAPVPPTTESSTDETDRDRRYQASMHLVLSLVFGLLVLLVVLGVIAKRVYDGWLRRHYRRMDFLIDGMYNGYD